MDPKLVKVVAMLGSEHDGEVLNAARLLKAAATAQGLTISELLLTPSPDDTDLRATVNDIMRRNKMVMDNIDATLASSARRH